MSQCPICGNRTDRFGCYPGSRYDPHPECKGTLLIEYHTAVLFQEGAFVVYGWDDWPSKCYWMVPGTYWDRERFYVAANGERLPAGSSGTTIINDGRPV